MKNIDQTRFAILTTSPLARGLMPPAFMRSGKDGPQANCAARLARYLASLQNSRKSYVAQMERQAPAWQIEIDNRRRELARELAR